MTNKERVTAAFLHKEPDRIPYYAFCTGDERRSLARELGKPDFDANYDFCLGLCAYGGGGSPVEGRPHCCKDAFGVVWDHSGTGDVGVVSGLVIEDIDDHNYHVPPLDKDSLRRGFEDFILSERQKDRFTVAGAYCTLFERAWSILGMENTLADIILSPVKLEELLEEITDFQLQVVDIALEYEQVDAIYFGDDWGQQHGLMMGKEHWDKLIRPCVKRLYDRVKSKGRFVIQHSCGDISELLPELIDMGLDCYQGLQPEIYDLRKVKETYGKHLSFWGGVSTQQVLPHGTPDEVYAEVKRVMSFMGKGGGYIAAPTVNLPDGIPAANYLAMIAAFEDQV